ncbi:MAG TPA: carbamoyltransferase N-terminal domain-containing protein [Polyangiales bacterium]|nr:carbamoyltransferase N-terminal domain-containing protein [Polyangiales bacterium]
MDILGISAFYHDSAACLVRDGVILAAAQEERFSRKKHDAAFPVRAVEYCLREAGIDAAQLDFVVFYDKPLRKLDRLIETFVSYAPRGYPQLTRALPLWLSHKLHVARELDAGLGGRYGGRYLFTEHHEAHAASAFFPSPFDAAAIVTLDGVGEWTTASIGVGRGNRIELLHELRFPHSLGLLYSTLTAFIGFEVNDGEYKLMGLAPYGEPIYRERMLDQLLDLRDDGSFRLNMDYFAYGYAQRMAASRLHGLLDGPPREPGAPLGQRELDIAASIQAVTEEIVLRIARHAHALTGLPNLVLAGGVALNCVANGKLLREGPFAQLWVQPAAGDAGGALGAALFVWHQLLERERSPGGRDAQQGSLLGPAFTDEQVRAQLDGAGARYACCGSEAELCDAVAQLIAEGCVVGHVAGRMELGPRALGNRSILGDPRRPDMQAVMNQKVKLRESFRPFAPAVLRERASEYFALPPGQESPYMQLVTSLQPDKLLPVAPARGLARLALPHSVVPAVTHVDGSARVQTVDAERNPRFHAIVQAFERRTGCPLVINTSFNLHDEPIVCTPADAYRCFMATHMDALVVERCVLRKHEQVRAVQRPPARSRASEPRGMTNRLALDLKPDTRKLRAFGWIALCVFGALGLAAWFSLGPFARALGELRQPLACALLAVALLSGALSLVYPRGNRALYLSSSVLAYPLGLVSSYALLALIFFGVFLPLGLLLRVAGKDPLERRFERARPSYWTTPRKPRDKASYFRMF